MKRVVIFSPNNFSFYTLCAAELLRLKGVKVEAVIVRKLFNIKRIVFEIKKNGYLESAKRIWDKVLARDKANNRHRKDSLSALKKQLNLRFNTVKQLGNHYGIPVIFCKNLNDDIVVSKLQKLNPDVVIFTGGGILRKNVLKASGDGVINCHSGILPQYRGMNVIERVILENKLDHIGYTVHFINEGIDTGDILRVGKVDLKGCNNIKQLKDRFARVMCEEIVGTAIDYLGGFVERKPQREEDGRQYFRMPYNLRKIAEDSFVKFQK